MITLEFVLNTASAEIVGSQLERNLRCFITLALFFNIGENDVSK